MKKLLALIYGIGTTLVIAGAALKIFWKIDGGKILIIATIICISLFQGRVISQLFKQLKSKEQNL